MNLFVTGGTGFLGSYFLKQASEAGHDITALRRPGSQPRIPLAEEPRWIEEPMGAPSVESFRGVDVLVHFAAAGVSPQTATWNELFRVNVTDSVALWHRASECGVKRFIICGSCFEYGAAGERYDFIPTDAPLEPTSGYGASKAAATMAALGLAREKELQMLILRPFHFYGDGQHPTNFWPSLREAALAGRDFPMTLGEQTRDFLPVEAVSEAFTEALQRELQPGRPIVENIGSGHPETLRRFAEQSWKQWGATGALIPGGIPYRKDEIMRYIPAISERIRGERPFRPINTI